MADNRLSLRFSHGISRVLHRYADWRIKPTAAEKHCYKQSNSILLTFDDYGSAERVQNILSILQQKGVKAIFFLQGDWASEHPELVTQIKEAGHIVGNHTYSHPDLLSLTDKAVADQIIRGVPGPWFRPPQGRYNARIREIAARHGMHICYWTIDSQDWTDDSVTKIRHTVLHELKPNAVILFHLHGARTAELLPQLIDDIRAKGYQLTPFSETWEPAS